MVVMGNMVKVYAWYDNEIGYSMRTAELARKVVSKAQDRMRSKRSKRRVGRGT